MTTYRDPRYPYAAGPRHSTTAVFDTSFDTRFGGPSRNAYDSRPISRGRDYYTQATPRTSTDPSTHSLSSYGNYGTRPRRNSSIEPTGRSTLSLSDQGRPLIRSQHDPPRHAAPKIYVPKDSDKVIYPATSDRRHQRHNSATTDDVSRMSLVERDQLDRSRSHRNSLIGRPKEYHSASTSRNMGDDDYSYTGPREQFERDYPVRPRPRRESLTRGERPVSMIDYNDYKAPPRREPPPASAKHFERLEKAELLRPGSRSGPGSEDLRRRESVKKPVSVHHDRDEGYSSQREDHERRSRSDRAYDDEKYMSDRERHRRSAHHDHRSSKPRHERHESKERSGISSTLAGLGASGLAALSAVALKDNRDDKYTREKDSDRDDEARRREKEKRHQERELERRERYAERERVRDKGDEGRHDGDDRGVEFGKDRSDSDSNREKLRRKHHRHESLQAAAAAGTGTVAVEGLVEEPREHRHRHRHRHRRHKSRDPEARERTIQYENEGGIVASPVDMRPEDQKPRKSVTVVEPSKESSKEEIKPKGILKKPTVAFPENPSTSREGVALFKDDPKKDQIPEGAKWTKIKREAVSPAACEAAGERFEARDDYVIVLRPLTRADVQKLATKTSEIRRARQAETEQPPPPREDDQSYSSDSSFTSSSYDSEDDRPSEQRSRRSPTQQSEQEQPLSIEAPPQHPADPIAQIIGQARQVPSPVTPAYAPAQAQQQPAQAPYQPAPYQPAPYQQQPYQQAPYQQAPYPPQTGYQYPPQQTSQK